MADIFTDCQNKFDNDKYEFLALLENTLNLDDMLMCDKVTHEHLIDSRPLFRSNSELLDKTLF